MILALDIGNSNIKAALFEGLEQKTYFRISCDRNKSSDEYGVTLLSMLRHAGYSPRDVTGIVFSSVVPTINFTIEHMCRNYFGIEPMSVQPGIKTGINIKYENPRELGSDRIANAVAADEHYGGPSNTNDIGTAPAIGVSSQRGDFQGGAICPGIKLAADALTDRTAKLPRFELQRPESVIGKNTVANMQSGIVYGYIGQVSYLVERMKREIGEPNAKVIATGGLALLVAGDSNVIDVLDGLLTLKGLCLIYGKNAG